MQAHRPILLHVRKAVCVQPTKVGLFTALPPNSNVACQQQGSTACAFIRYRGRHATGEDRGTPAALSTRAKGVYSVLTAQIP